MNSQTKEKLKIILTENLDIWEAISVQLIPVQWPGIGMISGRTKMKERKRKLLNEKTPKFSNIERKDWIIELNNAE